MFCVRNAEHSTVKRSVRKECSTRCIFQSNDADTAKWMSDTIGEIEISEYKEGLSYGANTIRDGVNISQQDRVKSVLLPSEILNMKRLNLILKMPDHPAVKARVKYKRREVIEDSFIKSTVIIEDLRSVYDDVQGIVDDTEDESNDEYGNITESRNTTESVGHTGKYRIEERDGGKSNVRKDKDNKMNNKGLKKTINNQSII